MLLDLVKLGVSPRPFDFTMRPGEIDLETAGVELASEVNVRGEARKNEAGVEVKGTANGALEIDCTRCLKAVATPFDIEFDVSFISPEHASSAKEIQLNQADLGADVFGGEELDLNELVREQILLSLPEQTLCREDCEGLCQNCGADLNEGDCGCGDEDIDPRWAALKGLK